MRKERTDPATALKYEVAEELGLLEKVLTRGWAALSTSESGRIGGVIRARRAKEEQHAGKLP